MAAGLRFLALAALLLLASPLLVSAQDGPEVRADEGDLVLKAADGARVRIGSDNVATMADVDSVREDAQDANTLATDVSMSLRTMMETYNTLSNSISDMMSKLSMSVADLGSSKADTSALNDGLATKANTADLDALAAGLEQSWPALETFDDGAQGWTKGDGTEYNTVTTCGAIGSLLGGYASPETQYSKTYNLPIHAGVQIELDYYFIDSWDNEQASVEVDGNVEWSVRHSFTKTTALGRVCGSSTSRFQEDVAHVVIRLPSHSARTLTLTVKAALSEPGVDESFGISNIRISAIQPGWPEIATFADGHTHGWKGDAAVVSTCGKQGTILGGAGNGVALTAMSRVFEYLPSHNGLRLQLRLFFLDTWPEDANVNIHLDGRLLWQGGPPADADANFCGGAASDAYVDLDLTHEFHTSSLAMVHITTTLGPADTEAAFGISLVELGPVVPRWPALLDFESADDAIGWSTDTGITACGRYGNVFGGFGSGKNGVERTFRNLPAHDGLTLSFTYVFVDTWDAGEMGMVYVDGQLVFQQEPSGPESEECGVGSPEQAVTVSIDLPWHTASTVTLRFDSNLNSDNDDESFAFTDVLLAPMEKKWPPMDTFETGIDGWTSNLPNNGLSTSTCGEYGSILGGTQLDRGKFVEKTFTDLPAHTGVQLSFDAIFIDSWDGESYIVIVDDAVVYREASTSNKGGQICGSANNGWNERRQPVTVVIPHTSSSLTMRVTTSLDQSGNDESFALDNVQLGAAATLAWPPVDTFEGGADGWVGTSSKAINCGNRGNLLGGDLGVGGFVTKQYLLPPHRGLKIRLRYFFLDSWDDAEAGIIEADGQQVWNEVFTNYPSQGHLCANDLYEDRHAIVEITLADHTRATLTLRVSGTVNSAAADESFAIDDVRILPLDA